MRTSAQGFEHNSLPYSKSKSKIKMRPKDRRSIRRACERLEQQRFELQAQLNVLSESVETLKDVLKKSTKQAKKESKRDGKGGNGRKKAPARGIVGAQIKERAQKASGVDLDETKLYYSKASRQWMPEVEMALESEIGVGSDVDGDGDGQEPRNILDALPVELLMFILAHVAVRDARAVACTCKSFCDLLLWSDTGELFWNHAVQSLWQMDEPLATSWRHTFGIVSRWTWDDQYGNDARMRLSNSNRTVTALGSDDDGAASMPSTTAVICRALIDAEYPYWSVRVDHMTADGITIGVATLETQLGLGRLGSGQDSYGYNSFASLLHQNIRVPAGRPYIPGDVVGVYLDLERKQLAFYLNGVFSFASASRKSDIFQKPLHLAVTLAYPGDQVTILQPLNKTPAGKRRKKRKNH